MYVPMWGEPATSRFPTSHGAVTLGSVMACKVQTDTSGAPRLEPAWISHEIAVPDPIAIAGGIAFVLGTGENTTQVHNGDINHVIMDRATLNNGHATLYVLDAHTGAQLWASGSPSQDGPIFRGWRPVMGK